MAEKIKILVVDDHQVVVEGIVSYLSDYSQYDITTCNTCDKAFDLLKKSKDNNPYQKPNKKGI